VESINFAQLYENSGGPYEPVPKNEYEVVIDSCEVGKSSTDKLMYKLKYKIVGGPQNGRTVYNNITLTTDKPNALKMFFTQMKAMGLPNEYWASNPSPDTVAAALVGRQCRIIVDHREWNGEMREDVKGIKPSLGGGPAVIPSPSAGPSTSATPPTPSVAASAPSPAPSPEPVSAPTPAPTPEPESAPASSATPPPVPF
jgi:hypothetical protein